MVTVVRREEVGSRRVARAPLEDALREAEAGVLAELTGVREALQHAVRSVAVDDLAFGQLVVERAGACIAVTTTYMSVCLP
jgi:hypothetical protein